MGLVADPGVLIVHDDEPAKVLGRTLTPLAQSNAKPVYLPEEFQQQYLV